MQANRFLPHRVWGGVRDSNADWTFILLDASRDALLLRVGALRVPSTGLLCLGASATMILVLLQSSELAQLSSTVPSITQLQASSPRRISLAGVQRPSPLSVINSQLSCASLWCCVAHTSSQRFAAIWNWCVYTKRICNAQDCYKINVNYY